jgi:hypothetical protein
LGQWVPFEKTVPILFIVQPETSGKHRFDVLGSRFRPNGDIRAESGGTLGDRMRYLRDPGGGDGFR